MRGFLNFYVNDLPGIDLDQKNDDQLGMKKSGSD
jgi:hypothetical protein